MVITPSYPDPLRVYGSRGTEPRLIRWLLETEGELGGSSWLKWLEYREYRGPLPLITTVRHTMSLWQWELGCATGLPTPLARPPFHDSVVVSSLAQLQGINTCRTTLFQRWQGFQSLFRWSPCFVGVPVSLESLSR